jgi:hypothetical protein
VASVPSGGVGSSFAYPLFVSPFWSMVVQMVSFLAPEVYDKVILYPHFYSL